MEQLATSKIERNENPMTPTSLKRNMVAAVLAAGCYLADGSAWGGVDYADPAGGWRYTYEGDFFPATGGFPPGFRDSNNMALDGTWRHDQGDKWDGTGPGDPLSDPNDLDATGAASTPEGGPAGTSPGGAASLLEGGTNYIRVQDAGNPEDHGWIQGAGSANTNRRVYFGHSMLQDGSLAGDSENLVIDTGMTVSFRARISGSGPLDDIYLENFASAADFDADEDVDGADFLTWQRGFGTDAGAGMVAPQSEGNANADQFINGADLAIWQEEFGSASVIPWFKDAPNGHGRAMTSGRGAINIAQYQPSINEDTLIGFSLVNSVDVADFCEASGDVGSLCSGTGSGGLIMNNLNGIVSDEIDSISGGTLNIVEISDADLNEWHEFWITMVANGSAPGATAITVYMDGNTTPVETFNVTLAGKNNSAYSGNDPRGPWLEFGSSDTDDFGSFDMDFYSYLLDDLAPTAATLAAAANVPEPASLFLLAVGLLALGGRTQHHKK
jgi:hypothetical protein